MGVRELFNLKVEEWDETFPIGEKSYLLESLVDTSVLKHYKQTKKQVNITSSPYQEDRYYRLVKVNTHKYDLQLRGPARFHTNLLLKMDEIYNKLILKVKYNGIIDEVENRREIEEKWQDIRKEINKKYIGYQVNYLCKRIDKKVASSEMLIQHIIDYHQYGLLLNDIYQPYDNFIFKNRDKNIVQQGVDITIDEEISLERQEDEHSVRLKIRASLMNNQYLKKYSGFYEIDADNQWIRNANLEIKYKTDDSLVKYKVTQI